jgi:hypothetical protein
MTAREYLERREWSMGNGQCPDCYGVPPDWLGHPLHLDASSIGHEPDCDLAAALKDDGATPVMRGEFKSEKVYELDWSSGFLSTRLKQPK